MAGLLLFTTGSAAWRAPANAAAVTPRVAAHSNTRIGVGKAIGADPKPVRRRCNRQDCQR